VSVPLSARLGDEVFVAPLLEDPEWGQLKGNASLLTTCCLTRAVATRRFGTRFFRHYHLGDCPYAQESWEHLLGKTVLARAAHDAGYCVTTEARGHTPDGTLWIADVLAERGRKRVALEMQWSPISRQTLRERQTTYEASQVKGIWFRRLGPLELAEQVNESKIPWFRIEHEAESRAFSVPDFAMDLHDFAVAALLKGLKWRARGQQVRHAYLFGKDRCYVKKCAHDHYVLVAEEFTAIDGTTSQPSYVDRKGLETAARVLTEQQLLEVGASRLKERFSRNGWYLSNGCPKCNAIYGESWRKLLFTKESSVNFRGAKRIADDVLEGGEWNLR
jgi:hypothetical protein